MADGVTYAGALAACVARFGAPPSRDERPERTTVAWVVGPRRDGWRDVLWLEGDDGCVMLVAQSGTEERLWLLAGVDHLAPGRAVTPLPDALDAADRWLRERTTATKGP